MALLRGIKAVPALTNVWEFVHNDHALTAEEAELIVADDNLKASEGDNQGLADPSVDLQSGIEKGILYKKKSIKNLILDVVTCWNLTYYMLKRALEFSEAIDAMASHPKIKIYHPYAPSTGDWAAIWIACTWLKFFWSALTCISGEKYPTLSFSLHIYFVLISYVFELKKEPLVQQNQAIFKGIQACKHKLQEFLDKSTKDLQYYYFAMMLNPWYKDTLFRLNVSSIERLLPHDWLSGSAESFAITCHKFYNTTAHLMTQPQPGAKDADKFEYAIELSSPGLCPTLVAIYSFSFKAFGLFFSEPPRN